MSNQLSIMVGVESVGVIRNTDEICKISHSIDVVSGNPMTLLMKCIKWSHAVLCCGLSVSGALCVYAVNLCGAQSASTASCPHYSV